MRGKK
jgi:hypothetical protein